ncbi:MAG: cytochrome C [Anditalea sp.]
MKIKRILLILISLLLLLVVSALVYVKFAIPNIPLKEISLTNAPDRIANGKYLANSVLVCMDCHSTRDWTRFSAPLVDGTLGKGGELFDQKMGFPGMYISKNITPFNLANWSDAEVFRAITSGVKKDGNAIFPVMPYSYYGKMDEEDIKDVIAYLRTLEPIDYSPEESSSEFPMSLIINTIPQSSTFTKKPAKEVSVEYGKYMVNAAACVECHTPFNGKELEMDKAFSGGREFQLPGGLLVSRNITPHAETGIGNWTKEDFVARFKAFDMENGYEPPAVDLSAFNTIMPWTMYASMDEIDLEAIYTYLYSLDGIENRVTPFVANK